MFSSFRNRFGIPGVISVVALVFALVGGAFAANDLGGSGKGATASAKKKATKGPRGPKGATGPAGPAGAAGPKGDTGAAGANGSNGADGAKGSTGSNGTSATVTPVAGSPTGPCGIPGGVKVSSASPDAFVCNGEAGASGSDGSPWTAGGTLPEGATQTGTWSAVAFSAGTMVSADISFPIQLEAALDGTHVHYFADSDFGDTCAGSVAEPTAPAGHLCVYGGVENGQLSYPSTPVGPGLETRGASVAGAFMTAVFTGAFGNALGTWAVTG